MGDVPQNRDVDVLTFAGGAQEKPRDDNAVCGDEALSNARLEMSEEERERRKQVCERQYEFCYDWCTHSRPNKNEQRKCYEDCTDKLTECLDKLR